MGDKDQPQSKKVRLSEPVGTNEKDTKKKAQTENQKQKENTVEMNVKMIQLEEKITAIKSTLKNTTESLTELDLIKKELQAANEKNFELNKMIVKLNEENSKLKADLDFERKSSMDSSKLYSYENFRKFVTINSEINLNLKNENTKLTSELKELKEKLKENQTQVEADVNKLKEENEFYKTENSKAFAYAAFYVKKLKEFEILLLKERSERTNVTPPVNSEINIEYPNNMYPLSENRFVKVEKFNGTFLVHIREYFNQNSQRLPSKKGISLSIDQFECLKKYISKIDSDLKRLK